jgi:DnaK suppressor protein
MNKSTQTAHDRKRYRKQLLSLNKRLSGEVVHLQAEAERSVGAEKVGTDEPAEQTDRAAREAEANVARTLLVSEGQILEDVRIALAHLDAGTFGVCEVCGQPIGSVRLDVLPYARQCLSCSTNLETT